LAWQWLATGSSTAERDGLAEGGDELSSVWRAFRIQPPLHQETVGESDDRRARGAGLLGTECGHAIAECGCDQMLTRCRLSS
jgi:hypothetical protein